MITPIILISTCVVSLFFAGLILSACMLAGKLDQHHLGNYEDMGPLDPH